jgi:hypothetical protein
MSPDDPRHGTRRGYYAHRKDDETACDACKRAAAASTALYESRRSHGTAFSVDPTGTQRRIKALVALGWTMSELDRRLGRHNTCCELIYGDPKRIRSITAAKIAALYETLSMRLPPQTTRHERINATRSRNLAVRNDWPPPLAWDNIDDPDEQPHGWKRSGLDRAAELRDLDLQRAGISEVCNRLRITRRTLEKWCARHEMTAIYSRFVDREQGIYWRNGVSEGGVA